MKNIKYYFGIIIFFGVVLISSSCVKEDFDKPEKKVYSVDFKENYTIAQLLKKYPGEAYVIDTAIVIKGTITAEDSHQNFYKKFIIQDSTGGLDIEIDQSSGLYQNYGEGQLVYIKLNGLVIQNYGGVKQIAFISNGTLGFKIPSANISNFVYKCDGGLPIKPKVKKITELTANDNNTLIQLEGVQFVKGDTSFTYSTKGSSGVNRTLEDATHNQIIVRTSGYSDFALDKLPKGNGSIVGVFILFMSGTNSTKQISIRKTSEVLLTGTRF